MIEYIFKFSNYRLREYERKLAVAELRSVFGDVKFEGFNNSIRIRSRKNHTVDRLEDLTFFSEVSTRNGHGDSIVIPRQVRHELSAKALKSGLNDKDLFEKIVNGQSYSRQLRYLTHLMHEYKGRFNPQVCKSLINIAGIKKTDQVLDPFMGSGTTLVECYLNGYSAVGIDLNPLSFLISKTKVESLNLDIKALKLQVEHFARILAKKNGVCKNGEGELKKLHREFHADSQIDLDYLKAWFPLENLISILNVLKEIWRVDCEPTRNLFLLALSDILINLSYQDPRQLRVMRRPDKEVPRGVCALYMSNLNRYCNIISTFQFVKSARKKCQISPYLGDVRKLREFAHIKDESVDLIVTSPPYATALPYIDTDRLSLTLLGYVQRKTLRQLESQMIGNREINPSERERLENEFFDERSDNLLPTSIKQLVKKVYDLNSRANVGFRRKNTAALLYKYFQDMYIAMTEMHAVLRPKKKCFMVVGCNNTVAGGKNIFIPTDDFIAEIGKEVGFLFKTKIALNVEPSYMIHRKNAIRRESVLILEKK